MTAERATAGAAAVAAASHEREFFDAFWNATEVRRITEPLELPGVDLGGKRVLICSCGSGEEPVRAVNAGAAEVHAFDLSVTAVSKAREVARFNGVAIAVQVMDFHALAYPPAYFDVIYGSAILHHVDCRLAGQEIRRCLRPGGVAYFAENSDRNPVLRWIRRALFGSPTEVQRSRALFFKRHGTSDEYPLTDEELRVLRDVFAGELRIHIPRFVFFELLAIHGWRQQQFLRLMQALDRGAASLAPALARYSFMQDVILATPAEDGRAPDYPTGAFSIV